MSEYTTNCPLLVRDGPAKLLRNGKVIAEFPVHLTPGGRFLHSYRAKSFLTIVGLCAEWREMAARAKDRPDASAAFEACADVLEEFLSNF